MVKKQTSQTRRLTSHTGHIEYFTPPEYIASVVEAMPRQNGSRAIDLDPASSAHANQFVGAASYFSLPDQDGLSLPWHGRVFLNPPYAMPLVKQFMAKLVSSCESAVTCGIALTNSATDTSWWWHALDHCQAVCFTKRTAFRKFENGQISQLRHTTLGQTFFYFGPDPSRFEWAFKKHGKVVGVKRNRMAIWPK